MTTEQGEKWLEEVYRGVRREHPELVRRLGVTMLNVAGRGTPPNPGGHNRPGKKGVKGLKARIANEILGENGKVVTAIPNAEGQPVKLQGRLGWGGYGFVVPRGKAAGRVKLVDPAPILRAREFKRARNVVRGRASRFGGWNWVSRAALTSEVARIQRRAGALITAWLPSARALRASNAEQDFDVSPEPRKGDVSMRITRNKVVLEMRSDWGGLIVGNRFLSSFDTYVRIASYKALQTTRKQFYKFLDSI
jgi:hypothetical protein